MMPFKRSILGIPIGQTPRRDKYALEEYLQSISVIINLDQLLDNAAAKLREMFSASSVHVVLSEPITSRFMERKFRGERSDPSSEFCFSRTDNLVRWLNVNQGVLEIPRDIEVMKFLTDSEQNLLQNAEIEIVIPLIVFNRLIGMIFLGRKISGRPYSHNEIEKMMALANQSALAIEHARLYQDQEDKLRKLFHADKLASVGELAAGVAHEIRNPLTSIRSTIQYLRKDITGQKSTFIDGVLEEVDRIDGIVKALLSFSRSSELKVNVVNLEEILHQTILLLGTEIRNRNILVKEQFGGGGLKIAADASQMKQVFLNIVMNSIQAMPQGGILTIASGSDDLEKGVPARQQFVWIKIDDTGHGISESDLPRVFDPFFTTKESGTGLGLSISYGIVIRHGGEIKIESRATGEQTGTSFTVRLPKTLV